MPTDNRTLVQKADVLLSQIASGGLLVADQADKFIRLAIKEAVMMKDVFMPPMKNPTEEHDKMRFAGRVLHAATEATALGVAQRSSPAFSLMTLTSQLYRAETRLSDEVLEDQIERGAFKNTITQELAKAIGRDMEAYAINGDTASADPDLAKQNGWIKLTTSNLVAAGGAQLSQSLLRDLLLVLPDEFTRMPELMYYTNLHAQIRYQDQLANRSTAVGDAALQGNFEPAYNKIKVKNIPEFPNNLGGGTNETVVLMSNPKNYVLGVQRKIRLKAQEDVSAGVVVIAASLRFAVNIQEETAAAKMTGVLGQ